MNKDKIDDKNGDKAKNSSTSFKFVKKYIVADYLTSVVKKTLNLL